MNSSLATRLLAGTFTGQLIVQAKTLNLGYNL